VSLLCRMVIGYYDPNQVQPHELVRQLQFDGLLDLEHVAQLQAACDRLFDIQLRLADHLTEPGALVIQGGSISRDMFCVACVAQELFNMTAVDTAHRERVYPRPNRELSEYEKNFRQALMEALPKESLEAWRQSDIQRTEFEDEVIRRVQAVREQRTGNQA
jgi:hypothetical protein